MRQSEEFEVESEPKTWKSKISFLAQITYQVKVFWVFPTTFSLNRGIKKERWKKSKKERNEKSWKKKLNKWAKNESKTKESKKEPFWDNHFLSFISSFHHQSCVLAVPPPSKLGREACLNPFVSRELAVLTYWQATKPSESLFLITRGRGTKLQNYS